MLSTVGTLLSRFRDGKKSWRKEGRTRRRRHHIPLGDSGIFSVPGSRVRGRGKNFFIKKMVIDTRLDSSLGLPGDSRPGRRRTSSETSTRVETQLSLYRRGKYLYSSCYRGNSRYDPPGVVDFLIQNERRVFQLTQRIMKNPKIGSSYTTILHQSMFDTELVSKTSLS